MKSAKKSSRTTRLSPWTRCAPSSGRQSSTSSAIPTWSAPSPPSPISSTHSDLETVLEGWRTLRQPDCILYLANEENARRAGNAGLRRAMKAKLFSGITLLALFGVVSSANSQEGFLYSGGNYTTLDVPGSTDTILRGINNSGQIVGDYSANNVRSGIFYSEGIFTTLNLPVTSDSTIATGINNFGQIVGSYGPASGNNSFLYSARNYPLNLLNQSDGIHRMVPI